MKKFVADLPIQISCCPHTHTNL